MAVEQSTVPPLRGRPRRYALASLWRAVVPELAAVPKRLRYRVSRWRNGTGPCLIEDAEDLIAVLPPASSWRLIERLIAAWEARAADAALPPIEALAAEQRAESRETEIQLRAMHDPAARALWIEAAEAEIAATRAAIASIRRAQMRTAA